MADDLILQDADRTKLDGIVQKMTANNENDADIQFVVNDFKQKYGVKKKEVSKPTAQVSSNGTTKTSQSSYNLDLSLPKVNPNPNNKALPGLGQPFKPQINLDFTKDRQKQIIAEKAVTPDYSDYNTVIQQGIKGQNRFDNTMNPLSKPIVEQQAKKEVQQLKKQQEYGNNIITKIPELKNAKNTDEAISAIIKSNRKDDFDYWQQFDDEALLGNDENTLNDFLVSNGLKNQDRELYLKEQASSNPKYGYEYEYNKIGSLFKAVKQRADDYDTVLKQKFGDNYMEVAKQGNYDILNDQDFNKFRQLREKQNELSTKANGLINDSRYSEVKSSREKVEKAQQGVDERAKNDKIYKVGDELNYIGNKLAYGAGHVVKMIAELPSLATSIDKGYDWTDKVADWGNRFSNGLIDAIPVSSDIQAGFNNKVANVDGYKVIVDDNGNAVNVTDSKNFKVPTSVFKAVVDKYNTDKTKYSVNNEYNPRSLADNGLNTVIDMGIMILGTKGAGMVGAGEKLQKLTSMGIAYQQTKRDVFNDAIKKGLDPRNADLLSNIIGVAAGTSSAVNPMEYNIASGKGIFNFLKTDGLNAGKLALIKEGKLSVKDYAKEFVKEGIKNTGGEWVEELGIENTTQALANNQFNRSISQTDMQDGGLDDNLHIFDKQGLETLLITAGSSFLLTPMEVKAQTQLNQQEALKMAIENPDDFVKIKELQLKQGQISQQQFDNETKIYNDVSKTYNAVKDDVKEELQPQLLALLTKKSNLSNKISEIKDEVLSKPYKDQLEQVNKGIESISIGKNADKSLVAPIVQSEILAESTAKDGSSTISKTETAIANKISKGEELTPEEKDYYNAQKDSIDKLVTVNKSPIVPINETVEVEKKEIVLPPPTPQVVAPAELDEQQITEQLNEVLNDKTTPTPLVNTEQEQNISERLPSEYQNNQGVQQINGIGQDVSNESEVPQIEQEQEQIEIPERKIQLWYDDFDKLKDTGSAEDLDMFYNKVKVVLNGIAQSKGEDVVKEFESLKKEIEDYAVEFKDKNLSKTEEITPDETPKLKAKEKQDLVKSLNKEQVKEFIKLKNPQERIKFLSDLKNANNKEESKSDKNNEDEQVLQNNISDVLSTKTEEITPKSSIEVDRNVDRIDNSQENIEISSSKKLKTNGSVEEGHSGVFGEDIVDNKGNIVGSKISDTRPNGGKYYQTLVDDTPENRKGFGWQEHQDIDGKIFKKFETLDDLEKFIDSKKEQLKEAPISKTETTKEGSGVGGDENAWGSDKGLTENFYTTDVDGYAIKKPITNPSSVTIDGVDFHIAKVDGDWKVIEKKSGLEISTGKISNTKNAAIEDATIRLAQNGGAKNLPKLIDRAIQGFKDRNTKAVEQSLKETPTETEVVGVGGENPALKDVEATAKALEVVQRENVDKFVNDFANIDIPFRQENIQAEMDSAVKKQLFPNEKTRRKYAETIYSAVVRSSNFPKILSEAYYKAKSDGSNPELVKAVEDALTPQTENTKSNEEQPTNSEKGKKAETVAEISPNKNVSASKASAIKDLIAENYSDLKEMEAGVLANLDGTELVDDLLDYVNWNRATQKGGKFKAKGLKGSAILKLAEKGYIEEPSFTDDNITLTDKGKKFQEALKARQETRKAIKEGTDLFPNDANLQSTDKNFTPISQSKFNQLLDKLKKAFPNIKVELFGKNNLENVKKELAKFGLNSSEIEFQSKRIGYNRFIKFHKTNVANIIKGIENFIREDNNIKVQEQQKAKTGTYYYELQDGNNDYSIRVSNHTKSQYGEAELDINRAIDLSFFSEDGSFFVNIDTVEGEYTSKDVIEIIKDYRKAKDNYLKNKEEILNNIQLKKDDVYDILKLPKNHHNSVFIDEIYRQTNAYRINKEKEQQLRNDAYQKKINDYKIETNNQFVATNGITINPKNTQDVLSWDIDYTNANEKLTGKSNRAKREYQKAKAVFELAEKLENEGQNTNFIKESYLYNKHLSSIEQKSDSLQFLKTKDGTIYGFKTPDGKVFLNYDAINANTPIHEFGHIWQSVFPNEFAKGISLLVQSPQGRELINEIRKNPAYKGKSITEIQAEALVTAIGNKGETIFNSNPTLYNKFKQWLNDLFAKIGDKLGIKNLSPDDKFDMFTKKVVGELLGGKVLDSKVGTEKSTEKTITFQGQNIKVKEINGGAEVVNGFYSPLEKIINETKFEKLPAKQWVDKFAKGEEAKWTGLTDWLSQQQDSVSKADIQQYLKDNRIQVVEVVKDDRKGLSRAETIEYNKIDKEIDGLEKERTALARKYYDENKTPERQQNYQDVTAKIKTLMVERKRLSDKAQDQSKNTKFSQYQLEGEKENYKEVLVTMPSKDTNYQIEFDNYISELAKKYGVSESSVGSLILTETEQEKFNTIKNGLIKQRKGKSIFKSSHFDEPNILVHLRMNTRVDADGNKVLFLEEVQSDWGQKGKKEGFEGENKEDIRFRKEIDDLITEYDEKRENGLVGFKEWDNYYSPKINELESKISTKKYKKGTPSAPFVTDTNAWTKLGLKVALKEAVKQGADKIAWTTGEQQNDRYDLSKQVKSVYAQKGVDGVRKGKFYVEAKSINGADALNGWYTPQELEGIVGKDLAEKISKIENEQTFSGVDLKVGGKGMKGFYGSPYQFKSTIKVNKDRINFTLNEAVAEVYFEGGVISEELPTWAKNEIYLANIENKGVKGDGKIVIEELKEKAKQLGADILTLRADMGVGFGGINSKLYKYYKDLGFQDINPLNPDGRMYFDLRKYESKGSLGIVGNVAKSLFKQEPKTVEISNGVKGAPVDLYKWVRENHPEINLDSYDKKEIDKNERLISKGSAIYKEYENEKNTFSTQHSIDITPEMKAMVELGQPLFQFKPDELTKKVQELRDFELTDSEIRDYLLEAGNTKQQIDDALGVKEVEENKDETKKELSDSKQRVAERIVLGNSTLNAVKEHIVQQGYDKSDYDSKQIFKDVDELINKFGIEKAESFIDKIGDVGLSEPHKVVLQHKIAEYYGNKALSDENLTEEERKEAMFKSAQLFLDLSQQRTDAGRGNAILAQIYLESDIYFTLPYFEDKMNAIGAQLSGAEKIELENLQNEIKELRKENTKLQELAKKEAEQQIVDDITTHLLVDDLIIDSKIKDDLEVKNAKSILAKGFEDIARMLSSIAMAQQVDKVKFKDTILDMTKATMTISKIGVKKALKSVIKAIKNANQNIDEKLLEDAEKHVLSKIKETDTGIKKKNKEGISKDELIELIEQGADTMEKMVEAIRDKYYDGDKSISDKQIRDEITNYGNSIRQSQTQVEEKLSEIKSLMLLQSKLEDAENNVAPKKTGFIRDKDKIAVREKRRELAEAMKKLTVTLSEDDIAGLNERKLTQIANKIEEVQKVLDGYEKIKNKANFDYNDAVKKKQQELDDLMSSQKALLHYAKENLTNLVAKYQDKLDKKQYSKNPTLNKLSITDSEYQKLKNQLEAKKEQLKSERDNFRNNNADYLLENRQKQIDRQIVEIDNLLAGIKVRKTSEQIKAEKDRKAGVINSSTNQTALDKLKENQNQLEAKKEQWERKIIQKEVEIEKAKQTWLQKIGINVQSISRTLTLGFTDIGWLTVQGGYFGRTKPHLFAKALKESFKGKLSEEAFNQWKRDLKSNPFYETMIKAGLRIPSQSLRDDIFEQEFRESGFTKLLGKNEVTDIVNKNGRLSVKFLANLRIQVFQKMYNGLTDSQKADKEELEKLADYVNSRSGAGQVIGEDNKRGLNKWWGLLTSARNTSAMLQQTYIGMLYGLYKNYDPKKPLSNQPVLRRQIINDTINQAVLFSGLYLSYLIANGLSGDDDEWNVETSPFSTNFLKLKNKEGDRSYFDMGGMTALNVATLRLLTTITNAFGTDIDNYKDFKGEYSKVGMKDFSSKTGLQILSESIFNRTLSLLAPIKNPFTAKSDKDGNYSMYGKTYTPTEFKLKMLMDMFIPMNLPNIYNDITDKDVNALNAIVNTLLNVIGVSNQNQKYDRPEDSTSPQVNSVPVKSTPVSSVPIVPRPVK